MNCVIHRVRESWFEDTARWSAWMCWNSVETIPIVKPSQPIASCSVPSFLYLWGKCCRIVVHWEVPLW